MSKYNYQKSNAGSKAVIVIALILAVVMAAYVTISLVFGSWNPAKWTEIRQEQIKGNGGNQGDADNDGDKDQEEPSPDDEATGGLVVGDIEENGIMLTSYLLSPDEYDSYGIAPNSADVYSISVTNARSELSYEWSLSNGGSTYVSLSATTGTSITLSAKQAFGSPITLTCTAKFEGNTVSTATCTLNYQKRFAGLKLNGSTVTEGSTVNLKTLSGKNTVKEALMSLDFNFTVDMTAGSVGSNLSVIGFTVKGVAYSLTTTASFAEIFQRGLNDGIYNETDVNQMRNGTYSSLEFVYAFGIGANETWEVSVAIGGNIEFKFNILFPSDWSAVTYTVDLSDSDITF